MIFGVIVLLLVYWVTSISPEESEKRVRQCLHKQLSQRHLKALEEKGLMVPDRAMAEQWEQEIKQVERLSFVSIEVKRPFFDIVLSETPTHVVRVVMRDEKEHYSTRYFWLSWDGIDRETSGFAWFLPF